MQSSLLGACVLETDRPDTAGYDWGPTCLASGESTWKSLLPRAGRCRPCSVSSCDAGAHPASSVEDGSQKPPCDPNLTRPTMPGDALRRSVRRASGLVQTPQGPRGRISRATRLELGPTRCSCRAPQVSTLRPGIPAKLLRASGQFSMLIVPLLADLATPSS